MGNNAHKAQQSTPISYAYEALICGWEGDSVALTSNEVRLLRIYQERVRSTKKIDAEVEGFVRMVESGDRWVQRFPEYE